MAIQNFVDLAVRLIKKNGRPVSIRRYLSTTLKEAGKPWKGVEKTPTDTTTVAAFFDTEIADLFARVSAVSRLVQSPVQIEGNVAFVPAKGLSFTIEPKMQLVDGDMVWEIKSSKPIQPGTTPVVYVLELAK